MKKFFLILSLALGLLVSVFGADSPSYPSLLTVGVYDNPPKLSVSPSGKASGFHIDLLDAILEGTGIEVRYVAGTFEESLQRLERGEIDLLLDVAYSDERALRFDFTTESILTNWAVVYAGRYSKIENFTDLDGARVAVLKDSIHTTGKEGIIAMAAEYGISLNLIYLDSYDECFAALRSGKADAAVVNRLFGLMSETGDAPRRTSILFNPSQIRYAFAKGGEHNAALIALFDSRLNSLKASPESAYRRAFDTYLGPQISKETSGLPWLGIATTLVIAILFILLFIVYAIRVGKSDKVEIQRFIDNLQTMEDIRKSIVNNSLVAYSVFSLLLALMAIRHLVIVGNDIFIWFYLPAQILPAVISLFKDRLSLSFKTTALLILLLLSGTVITLARGNSGISFSYFFLAAILSTMLQGRRLGMATLASGLAVVLMALILNYTGILHSTVTDASFFLSPSSWAFSVLSFFMFFFAILAGMKDFYTSLTKAVVNLEEGIAERTRNIKAINEELKNEIDEHMKTEEKLSQARHEAEQANRTKSSFFAGISHELRTPLNAILGYSQILMRDASLSKESMRQVETIKTSGEHLLGLINEVLEMSRIEAGKVRLDLSPCAISSVLEEIRMLFAGQASRKGLAFSVREESPLPDCVMTDRSKLKQILINLVGNAMKFTDSGFIDVRVAGSAQHPDIVEFSVRDTGKGIPPDAITRIFLPFEQTIEGRSQGGTGLGLPICRNYCELLGGKISAESSLGKGSVFSFTIQAPECVDAKVSDEPIPSRVVSIKNSARPRILVVDDKSINRDILVNMLVPIGFVVEQAEDGEKALSLLRTAFFDIVLLDYVMPGVSGRELVDALRASAGQSRLRIILMTGSLLENQQLDIQALGVDALLAKPVLERSLLSEIKRLACIDYNCSDDEEKNSGVFCSDEEAKRRLSTISSGLFETLRDSITSGDLEDVKSIAQEIARGDERLGKTLADWAGGIQMDRLLRLIK